MLSGCYRLTFILAIFDSIYFFCPLIFTSPIFMHMIPKIIPGIVFTMLFSEVHAQRLEPGTTIVIEEGTELITNSALEVRENSKLVNNGTVYLANDLVNNGNAAFTGKFYFNGKTDQEISGSDSFAFTSLHLNTANKVRLNSKVAIIDELILERGVLQTTVNNPVVFLPVAQSPAETKDGYVEGTAIMSERAVGTGSLNFLGVGVSAGTDLGNVGIVRTTGEEAILKIGTDNSIASNWVINTSVEDAKGHDISLSWVPAFDNNHNPDHVSLFANTSFDEKRFVKLNDFNRVDQPTVVNMMTELRTCTKEELDFINRTFTLAEGSALTTVSEKNKITTFPNPATDHINVLLENYETWATNVQVKVTDAYGKEIYQVVYIIDGSLIKISNLGSLAPGLYRMFIAHGQNIQVVNFVKN